jgi:hypothetical protein
MSSRTLTTIVVVTTLAFGIAPMQAQSAPTEQIHRLEQKLDELLRQAAAIRQELDALKDSRPQAEEDLTQVDLLPSEPSATTPSSTAGEVAPTATAEAATALTEVQPLDNQPPTPAKIFNPDMSVVGTFLGHAGERNAFEFGPDATRSPMALEEAELALEAFVDPYAKAKFFLGVSGEGIDIEEGYAQFITLPYGLTAKVGKTKAVFGKANTWHTHVRPWADQPLMIHNFFGEEGLADSGVSVSKIFPGDKLYLEATGEVFSGEAEGVFGRQSQNDLFYNGHLRLFKDISENSNLEVGTSLARGTEPEVGGASTFGGVDVTWRWKPLQQGSYRSFIARAEGIVNDREDLDGRLFGAYVSADLQLARRWFAGLRLDRADRAFAVDDREAGRMTDRGVSATLTFWPSEFSQLRGQVRHTSYGHVQSVTEFLLQLQFAIGAHGAHTF